MNLLGDEINRMTDDVSCRWTSEIISSKAEYGLIPREHWVQPDSINEEVAAAARQKMVDEDIIYGGESERMAPTLASWFVDFTILTFVLGSVSWVVRL